MRFGGKPNEVGQCSYRVAKQLRPGFPLKLIHTLSPQAIVQSRPCRARLYAMIAEPRPSSSYGAHVEPAAPALPTTTSRTCWRGSSGLASLISERPLASRPLRLLAIFLSLTGWSAACRLRLDTSRVVTESTASCMSYMPWMGIHRQPYPGRVCTVPHAMHGGAPSDEPCTGLHRQSCPGGVCTISLHGWAPSDMPWMGTQVKRALDGYAPSVMPCMGMRRQTGPGWVHRSDMPWMGTRRQSCHALVCTVNHARHGRAPSDMPWMGTQVIRHALDGYEPSVMPCMGMHRPSCPR